MILLLFILIPTRVFLQPRFGFTLGLNTANFSNYSEEELRSRTGIVLGVYLDDPRSGFSFRPELLYSAKGAAYSKNIAQFGWTLTQNITLEYNYIELPFLAKYTIETHSQVRPFLLCGTYVGFLVVSNLHTQSLNDESGSTDTDIPDQSLIDMGLAFGGGISIGTIKNIFNLSFRYSFGFIAINEGEMRNSCFTLLAGMTL
jgi:hypothetical protein